MLEPDVSDIVAALGVPPGVTVGVKVKAESPANPMLAASAGGVPVAGETNTPKDSAFMPVPDGIVKVSGTLTIADGVPNTEPAYNTPVPLTVKLTVIFWGVLEA